MKKLLLSLLLFLSFISSNANFSIWGSAIYLNVNGTSGFYNTQKLTGPAAIGTAVFGGNLGVFGYNAGTLKILGAEINTSKDNGSNICSGILYYTVYQQGNRPVTTVFSPINLSMYCTCNGSSFLSCGGGACTGTSDQKLQNESKSIDLTAYAVGDYTIEIFYQVNGDNDGTVNCDQQRFDNNAGSNYTVNFSITAPLILNFLSINGISLDDAIKIKWVTPNDVNVVNYEIQRSENGLLFEPFSTITADRSAFTTSYFFTDADPIFGTNYYRIKVYYTNNTVNLSNVFRIYFGKVGNTILIYSNPSGSELAVRLAAVNRGNYQMSILNVAGQQIFSMPVNHDGNDKTIRINMPVTLAKTVYWLFLIDKTQFYKQTFLVK